VTVCDSGGLNLVQKCDIFLNGPWEVTTAYIFTVVEARCDVRQICTVRWIVEIVYSSWLFCI